jgi:nucleoside-diphosphate-sugar epimerase
MFKEMGPIKKVLVVGGAGYVGGWLVDQLTDSGHEVRVIDKLLYDDSYLKKVYFRNIDITDSQKLYEHVDWAESVIWLAALVGDPACALNPGLTYKINVESLKSIIGKLNKRFIFLSTCSVYGAQDGVLDEQSPLNPLSIYAKSKIEAEELILENLENYVIFRLGTLFGVSDAYARLRADLVVNILTIRAFSDSKMEVFGGQQYRPLLHVRDVSTGILAALNSELTGVYNLHTENLTVLDIAQKVQKIIPTSSIVKTEMSFQDSRNYQVSSSKAAKELAFKPKFDVEYGIKQIVEIMSEGRIRDITIPRFSNALALDLIHNIKK